MQSIANPFGDGAAADRIVQILQQHFARATPDAYVAA
jgi:UDP-N-acetylglucosamine 2-epimerase